MVCLVQVAELAAGDFLQAHFLGGAPHPDMEGAATLQRPGGVLLPAVLPGWTLGRAGARWRAAQIVATRASWLLYRPVQPLILVSCVDQPRLLFKHKARSTDMAMQAYFSSCKVTMDYQHWYLGPNTQGEGRDLRSRPIGDPGGRGRRIAACFESVIVIRCTCSGRLRPWRPLSR